MPNFPDFFQTARLDLRPFKDDDWMPLHELYGDIECTRFTFKRAFTEGESWRAMCSMVGHWVIRGYGPLAAVERDTGAVIGTIGLWYPNDWPEPEIKWALARRFWGKGYASEAVRAIQGPAFECLGKAPISFIDAENKASIQLASAVGAVLERRVEFRGSPWQIYRHPAPA